MIAPRLTAREQDFLLYALNAAITAESEHITYCCDYDGRLYRGRVKEAALCRRRINRLEALQEKIRTAKTIRPEKKIR